METELHIFPDQKVTFYKSSTGDKGTIFYLHGGGLIYGDKDDLPYDYIQIFLNEGYNFYSSNYLLAPESNYEEILKSVYSDYNRFINRLSNLSKNKKVIVFGRSAGAFLCYQIIMNQTDESKPFAFLDFYGFYNILDAKLTSRVHFYDKYPDIKVNQLTESVPIYSGNITKRFPIYLFARKHGSWIKMLDINTDQVKSIDFDRMPPTLILHATNDQDVPFSIALSEKSRNKKATLKAINSNQHDFDRTVNVNNLELYHLATNWLNKI